MVTWSISLFILMMFLSFKRKEQELEADHMENIEQVLEQLNTKGFLSNLRYLFSIQNVVTYLGPLLTTGGLKHLSKPKKIEAMKKIEIP